VPDYGGGAVPSEPPGQPRWDTPFPARADVELSLDEQLIVGFYSRQGGGPPRRVAAAAEHAAGSAGLLARAVEQVAQDVRVLLAVNRHGL
jgi:hypothetical protein